MWYRFLIQGVEPAVRATATERCDPSLVAIAHGIA